MVKIVIMQHVMGGSSESSAERKLAGLVLSCNVSTLVDAGKKYMSIHAPLSHLAIAA
jgi:hypothetical protein